MTQALKPLDNFPLVHTTDVDEARNAVCTVYLSHAITQASSRPMNMTLNAYEDPHVTVGFLTYQAETTLHMPASENFYHLNLTTTGHTFGSREDGKTKETSAGANGLLLMPNRDCSVRWSVDAEQIILRFSRTRLENHAADLLGENVEEPVDFDFGVDLSTASGQSLLASAQFMATELNRVGGIAKKPILVAQLESFVMSNLLMAVPNSYSQTLLAPVPKVNLGRLKPIVEFMEANAQDAITPADLARLGYMSVRTLHSSFQDLLGTTPMEHLRMIRMQRARSELVRNSDPNLSIADLAGRWGFYHPSRFAARYQKLFCELPHQTIKRHL